MKGEVKFWDKPARYKVTHTQMDCDFQAPSACVYSSATAIIFSLTVISAEKQEVRRQHVFIKAQAVAPFPSFWFLPSIHPFPLISFILDLDKQFIKIVDFALLVF